MTSIAASANRRLAEQSVLEEAEARVSVVARP